MGLEIELDRKKKCVYAKEPSSISSLVAGCYGKMHKGAVELTSEEALYLLDIRNAKCADEAGNLYKFNDLAGIFGQKRQMARYFTYGAWRDRGLVARGVEDVEKNYGRSAVKKYPEGKFEKFGFGFLGRFYADDLYCVIDDEHAAKKIYEEGWFGQFGTYKADKRGKLGKLDVYETLFLMKHSGLDVENAKEEEVEKIAKERRKDFGQLYEVYEDWRMNGFVLKTGFKFGTHFRVYFPGATPVKGGGWVHSQHVLQIFARKSEMLISEWARAIRVAHSVRKTFVLAINGQKKKSKGVKKGKIVHDLDFLLYHRRGQDIEKPKKGKPKYLMLSLSEEEYLSGERLAKAIEECKSVGLELILGIADRESSVTFYAVKRIDIPSSEYEYYEIEWVQP
ncbi:MAG: tRNA-intron lyase [Candidatus Micrarchaeota archaeon]